MFFEEEFDKTLTSIVPETDMETVIYNLIKWSITNNLIHDLIEKANNHSNNPKIKDFYTKIM